MAKAAKPFQGKPNKGVNTLSVTTKKVPKNKKCKG